MKYVLKKICRLYSQHKLSLLLLLFGIPLISKLDIWLQTVLGMVVDHISGEESWKSLAVVYAMVAFSLFLIKQGYSMLEQRFSFKVTYRLRAAIAEKVLHMRSQTLTLYADHDILHMWNEDVNELETVSIKNVFNFAILFVSALLALWELGKISLYFPVVALVVNIVAIVPVKIIGQKNKQRSQQKRCSQIAMNEKFYTILNAIRLIKSYNKEKKEIAEFETINERYVDDKLAFAVSTRIYKSVIDSVKSIAPTLILLIANFQIRDGKITIGDIVLATSLLETVSKPFKEGGNFFVGLKAMTFKFEHLFQFFEEKNEPTEGMLLRQRDSYGLTLQHVFYEVQGVDILKDINLTIQAGEKIAIVGESGSGKTTLNHLLLRMYEPKEGKVLLEGKDVWEYDLKDYRGAIHYSQSNPYITDGTIMDNLTLLGASQTACIQMAKAICFHDDIMNMPQGYHTVLEAGGANISGGQKKKIAIIRALTQRSRIYILDELTRGIDEASAEKIMEYLLEHIKATVIFTMHNFYAIEQMDQVIVMRDGCIVAKGQHEELYQTCAYYRELYNSRRREQHG